MSIGVRLVRNRWRTAGQGGGAPHERRVSHHMEKSIMKGLKLATAVVACSLFLVSPVLASRAEASRAAEDPGTYAELLALLEREIGAQLTRHLQEEGRLRQVTVSVAVDPQKRRMVVDFGPGYLPGDEQNYGELFLIPLAADLRHYSDQAGLEILDVEFLFQGKPIEAHFPEDHPMPRAAKSRSAHTQALVSSSHGYIALHPSRAWEFQRPAPLGLQEDVLSPTYGDELQDLLEQRSGLVVHRARSRSKDPHPESGHPWEQMSSRYHLKALFPERADIWNELPNSPSSDREVKEDIRARPNYANHLGVDVMLSLHTNGNAAPGVRGAEVYHHRTKPEDKALGDSILCGMREVIHAQPGYESFPVRAESVAEGHGENRIGKMPSVIVETAYHSNPEDVAALQDPVFRSAAMKGVEKGYRLWATGKSCEPLTLAPIADVEIPTQSAREIELGYQGNPQYPVTIEFTSASCSKPGACTPTRTLFEDPTKPIRAELTCKGSNPGVARWSVVLRDADGVATPPVVFQHACVQV
ncbi:N-acetylmuramoyl-L-alanine amidase family protein [Stenotrophomonas indicatrix]|uniref:N-acetylmuramoyl-L-alanine amidase n=1 Tax=Stenotrophomonas indicatrix TaxID=2045451 RepID=A0ABT8Q7K0_9GAMM|nr:N-acetylmuramoyl-L-alanine amidase [Stenotrophomonas indicatrix]MDN8660718.1 N-acetylmuramoyl-L-alanine amidase [Stenotrophomonas indicatrix]MDN8667870.1 N-acetylmuramoyl-L-alanine amidase [Stenotrophomonas indicatrix]